jgi:hypothetical protein
MSIYEVMAAAAEYREASAFNGECVAKINLLRAAIEQHVAEEVAREREELLDLVDSYAKDNAALRGQASAACEGPLEGTVMRLDEK